MGGAYGRADIFSKYLFIDTWDARELRPAEGALPSSVAVVVHKRSARVSTEDKAAAGREKEKQQHDSDDDRDDDHNNNTRDRKSDSNRSSSGKCDDHSDDNAANNELNSNSNSNSNNDDNDNGMNSLAIMSVNGSSASSGSLLHETAL